MTPVLGEASARASGGRRANDGALHIRSLDTTRLFAQTFRGNSDGSDPQSDGAQEQVHRAAICVRIVDVHVSCSSHCDTQLAAFFIDPRAKGSTGEVIIWIFVFARHEALRPGQASVSCS